MHPSHRSTKPEVHAAARRIAERFVYIIQAVLRAEERGDALREAYQVAVEELETFGKGGAG